MQQPAVLDPSLCPSLRTPAQDVVIPLGDTRRMVSSMATAALLLLSLWAAAAATLALAGGAGGAPPALVGVETAQPIR